ncbi:uncharacterized protein LACBIDRAFT_321367 [Laccaria bicolor S238N-H82]|uniref:Predicted protein n=1 Tax=Laccaria bicolor (strain S238N-H82 / ATCC MYA-4686) TaxID=486041 RepID=B0CPY7_LACBS|nr:uncharacterized protein LACBIDRAFT_321367 [Laccaria bicolor S238N-H82]EDR15496.1 predicted protein [Laccaria bicolor S238N-H82]|eukprot:XP_001873704.1 predicted protein [Laccaria bicolor S238N-H82]
MADLQFLDKVKCILNAFEDSDLTAHQFLHALLLTNTFEDHPVTLSIIEDLDTILDTVSAGRATSDQARQWVFRSAQKGYQAQVFQLTKKESGLHFSPGKMTNAQLMENKIEKLSTQMKDHAPDLWRLVAYLLAADPAAERRWAKLAYRKAGSGTQKANPRLNDGDITMGDAVGDGSGDEMLENGGDIGLIDEDEDALENLTEQVEHQLNSLIVIKQVLCLSIMMHSTNQECNSLQSIIGVFLHACNAPDAVLELLTHLGVSISPSTISNTVSNLSKESSSKVHKLGRTLLTFRNSCLFQQHLILFSKFSGQGIFSKNSGSLAEWDPTLGMKRLIE